MSATMTDDDLPADWIDATGRAPERVPDDAPRPDPLLFDDQHRPIRTVAAWQARREEIRSRWLNYLGTIDPPDDAPPRLEVIDEDRPRDGAGVIRRLVRYEAEPGLPVEAYLLRPDGPAPAAGRPGAVVLHSTTVETIRQPAGLADLPSKHFGLDLARRGYVAFCPRCFLWQYGDPKRLETAVDWLRNRHPGVTGMAKMLYDARRALDALAAEPDVDRSRLTAVGHSLGAKEALYLAAFDDRVRAAVASEGGVGLTFSNWDAPWYLGPAIRRPGFPLDHAQVLALIPPRAILIIGGDSADGDRSWPLVAAAREVAALVGHPRAVGLFNHRQGHSVPESAIERIRAWLDHFSA
jgi:dienelactone hydrolase